MSQPENFSPITLSIDLPLPTSVIRAVEALAHKQGMKGLQFKTKTGHILWDSAWIAGVDYEEDDKDQDYDDKDVELPGVNIDEEEEEQVLWEDLDENEVADLLNDANNPIQPEPQEEEPVSDDKTDMHQEEEEVAPRVKTVDPHEEEDEIKTNDSGDRDLRRLARQPAPNRPMNIGHEQTSGQSYEPQSHCNIEIQDNTIEYDESTAMVIAMIICTFNDHQVNRKLKIGTQNIVTYMLKKAIKKFGEHATDAALKEMKQLLDQKCFVPIKASTLTPTERKQIMESLLFLVEKHDGTMKGRHCANGSIQRSWISSENAASPTVATESVLLSAVINAEEGRDVAVTDIPNAFIQTELPEWDEGGNRTIMKIRGVLVEILCNMDKSYEEYVMYEQGEKVLYVQIIKAIYGLLVSALLFYKKFRASIKKLGFKVNPYDPCVANKMVQGAQFTIMWHVDDVKSSHVDPKVNDGFIEWLNQEYGQIKPVTASRGKRHDYLGMILDYTEPGKVKIDMVDYAKDLVGEFPQEDLKGPKVSNPASKGLFKVDKRSPMLDKQKAKLLHSSVLKGLFMAKRGRPDLLQPIAYLCMRMKEPTRLDWFKWVRVLKFLKQTINDCLTLQSNGSHILIWSGDSSFAVHHDMRSHTGGMLTMGRGAITNDDAPTASSAKSVDTKVRSCSTRWLLDWKLGPTC